MRTLAASYVNFPVPPGRSLVLLVAHCRRGAPALGPSVRMPQADLSAGVPRPVPSSPGVSRRMSEARRRDTAPEMLLRRELHRRGLRYRVDALLPGMPRRRADLLFGPARIAVFVDGCFWHMCPEHASFPAANGEWWLAKLRKNVQRDRETDDHLRTLGWMPLRFWEHEPWEGAAEIVERSVRDRRATR